MNKDFIERGFNWSNRFVRISFYYQKNPFQSAKSVRSAFYFFLFGSGLSRLGEFDL